MAQPRTTGKAISKPNITYFNTVVNILLGNLYPKGYF